MGYKEKVSRICLVGIYPPPLHGMSLISEYVKQKTFAIGSPLVIDLSPGNLNRSFMARFRKIFRVIPCVFRFIYYLCFTRVGAVYIGLSGGNGQVYDAIFSGLSRVFGRTIYLHHHSYQYLNSFRWLAKLLFAVAGKKAVHIVACEKMACDLKDMYPIVSDVRIISGIAALDIWDIKVRERNKIESIGFLSNIAIEKGIMEFLNVAAWAEAAHLPVHFQLAGPYQDDNVKTLVNTRLQSLGNVTYIGPVYGMDKLAFFDSIDVFLFPTKYINESEGLVIHEAMCRGVPVIAYSRGCIEAIITDQVGLCLAPADDYVAGVMNKINEWLVNPQAFQSVSLAALDKFNNTKLLESVKMDALCTELVGRNSGLS